MKRWLVRALKAFGGLLLISGLAYWGLIQYLEWREADSPSTTQVLVTAGGERILLFGSAPDYTQTHAPNGSRYREQAPMLDMGSAPAPISTSSRQVASDIPDDTGAGSSIDQAFYPPTRILIPSLGIDRPVLLSTNDHMPRFQGVGWFLGSAYPGHPGNMVLFGHLDGPYATFGNLRQLEIGSVFQVVTAHGTISYKVTGMYDTPRTDVSAMSQDSSGATATLITCSGTWDRVLQDYSERFIVKAIMTGSD